LNEFAQILTSKRVDLVFFDYLHEYVDIFSSIDLIANFFKVKIFGIFSSKFLRDLSRNQSIRNDYEYLKDFDSLKMFTYDDLINSDTLRDYKFSPLSSFQEITAGKDPTNCPFCLDVLDFNDNPVISIFGNISTERNLIFLNSIFDQIADDFNIFISGHLVNNSYFTEYLEPMLNSNKNIFYNPVKPKTQEDLVHLIQHVNYLIFDSERHLDPSGICEIFLKLGKGVIVPQEQSSFMYDLLKRFPNAPIYAVKKEGKNLKSLLPLSTNSCREVNNFYAMNKTYDSLELVIKDFL
jgi:hypothetical protein